MFKFFARNIRLLTFSGFKELCFWLTNCPPTLNTLYDGTLVAHTQRYLCATTERRGICLHSSFHHSSGDSSMSKAGYCKYMSISRLTYSDTLRLSAPCAENLDEILPKIALNLPFFFDNASVSSLKLSLA